MRRSLAAIVRTGLAILGALAVSWFVFHAVRAARFPYPLDYAEGPLLEQARVLASGGNIYRGNVTDYPFTVANYPPVFVTLLAALCRITGPAFGAARALTAVAAMACAGLVGCVAWTASGERLAGWVATATFLASPYVVFWSQLVRVDFVALAASLGAVLLVLRRPDSRVTMPLAAVLLAVAVLTRQSHLLAGPLAVTGALATKGARPLASFVLVLGLLLVVSVFGLDAATHGGFWFDTVRANENRFVWPQLVHFVEGLAVTTPVLLVLAPLLAARRARAGGTAGVLLGLYLLGTALSALTIGKVGAHVNYLLELTAALSIFAGIGVAAAFREDRLVVPALVLAQILRLQERAIVQPDVVEGKLGRRAEFAELERIVAAERGTVLADEAMGILVLAAHPIALQPFEFTQLVRQGVWVDEPVVRDILARRFPLILVNDGPETPASWTLDRWTPRMLEAIHHAYAPTGALAFATLYRPRPELLP